MQALSQENILSPPKGSPFAVGDAICSAEECARALHGEARDRSQPGDEKGAKTFSQSQDCPCITGGDTQLHSRDLLPHLQGEKMFPHCLISHQPLKPGLDAQIYEHSKGGAWGRTKHRVGCPGVPTSP